MGPGTFRNLWHYPIIKQDSRSYELSASKLAVDDECTQQGGARDVSDDRAPGKRAAPEMLQRDGRGSHCGSPQVAAAAQGTQASDLADLSCMSIRAHQFLY